MRSYEMMTVLRPDMGGEDDFNAFIQTLHGYITAQGGEIKDFENNTPWGRRKLAYPIQDFTEGFYILSHFQLDPSRVEEVERNLKLATPILRYLLILDGKQA